MLNVDVFGNKKRKRCGRVFRFKNFGEYGYPVEFIGSFRDNVHALLEFSITETDLGSEMPIWSFQLEVHRHPPFHVFLFVIEESIEAALNRHCKHCQFAGWGNHFICNKKYHFLLPSKDTLATCLRCEHRRDAAAATNNSRSKLLELQDHMMHGVFHSNGFGHLLCINGVETGSDLTGYQIMEFWDRLCIGLQARKVSLKDSSKKRGMELRLLNGVAYGEPWFGCWGYKFGRGCFGVTQPAYEKAIEAMRNMPLYLVIYHVGPFNHDIPVIYSRYQTLSDQSLVTLGDLFHFMLELKLHLPRESSTTSCNNGVLIETNSRWSPKRIEMATRVIVESLKRAEFRWISRQEVREIARTYIGDTGLLDFVLKSLGNRIVGNYLVRRSMNPVTKVLEYCLEDISDVLPNHEGLIMNNMARDKCKITRTQLMKDMLYVYKYLLIDPKPTLNSGIFSAITLAARIILDAKYLIKEYLGELPFQARLGFEGKLSLYCTILLRNSASRDENLKKVMPPYECITLKSSATIDDLKTEVERNFREIYWGLRNLVAESILNLNANGTDMVFGLIEVDRKLVIQGWNNDQGIHLLKELYEFGPDNHIVDCTCGAKEDDGERMISCDICEIWQHSRCVHIPNDEDIPHIFLCKRCEQEIVHFPSLP